MKYLIPFFAISCSDVKSSALNTNGIHADITAFVVDDTTELKVIMRVGGQNSTTYVELDEGDTLEASDGTETKEFGHSSFGAIHTYSTTFDRIEPGTEFLVSLKRELEDPAPNSMVTLSQDFTIENPEINETHSRINPLTIVWAGEDAGDEMHITVDGSCIIKMEATTSFVSGSYTFNSNDFESFESDEGESCEIDITLERRLAGTLDPAFGSGSVYGGFRRVQTIRLDP